MPSRAEVQQRRKLIKSIIAAEGYIPVPVLMERLDLSESVVTHDYYMLDIRKSARPRKTREIAPYDPDESEFSEITDVELDQISDLTICPKEDSRIIKADTEALLSVLPDECCDELRVSFILDADSRAEAERVVRPNGRITYSDDFQQPRKIKASTTRTKTGRERKTYTMFAKR